MIGENLNDRFETKGNSHMNFEFSDEQNMLREQAQTFLRAECPPQAVRTVLDGDAPFDQSLWQKALIKGCIPV